MCVKGYEEIKDDEDVYNEKYNDCDIVIDESYIERLKNCVEEQTEEQKMNGIEYDLFDVLKI